MSIVIPCVTFVLFQSTPPAEARGDEIAGVDLPDNGVSIHSPRRSEGRLEAEFLDDQSPVFQSTPPAEARGDAGELWLPGTADGVSIHSPRRSEGDRSSSDPARIVSVFQSTPPAEARGDIRESTEGDIS